jgi:hypothetical protein
VFRPCHRIGARSLDASCFLLSSSRAASRCSRDRQVLHDVMHQRFMEPVDSRRAGFHGGEDDGGDVDRRSYFPLCTFAEFRRDGLHTRGRLLATLDLQRTLSDCCTIGRLVGQCARWRKSTPM